MKQLLKIGWQTLKVRPGASLSLVVLSVLLGFVPVVKSAIESSLIGLIDRVVRGEIGASWSARLVPVVSDEADSVERVSASVLRQFNLVDGIVVYLAVIGFTLALTIASASSRGRLTAEFFRQLYAAALGKALGRHKEPARAVNVSGKEASALQQGATALSDTASTASSTVQTLTSLVSTATVLLAIDWRFLLMFLGVVLVMAVVAWIQARTLNHRREQYDDERNQLLGYADDVLARREVILTHERQDHYRQKLRQHAATFATTRRIVGVREQAFSGISQATFDSGLLGILIVAFLTFATIDTAASGGAASAYFFVALYTRLYYIARDLLDGIGTLASSVSTSRTFMNLLNQEQRATPVPRDADVHNEPADATTAVRFDRVSFSYPDGTAVLDNCTFTVPRGGMTLLVGPSGVGKTTIARIILGFLEPTDGSVSVYDRDLANWDRTELWRMMSYAPQRGDVLDDTVRDNFFNSSATDEEFTAALQTAGLDPGVPADGYLLDRPAGDLSLGQQQRLAVARLLVDTSSLIIMDEPLAGVDVFTFRDLDDVLGRYLRDQQRTVLVISHRLAFASYADHVVVLGNQGTVDEQGTPAELRANGGTFAELMNAAEHEIRSRH